MKRCISILLLLSLALSLCACDISMIQNMLQGTTAETTLADRQTTPEETTPEETTPPDAEAPADLSSVSFKTLSLTTERYTFLALINTVNANAYVDLESFFNYILVPALFSDVTFEESTADVDWYVDDAPAKADTKVFNGSIVSFIVKDDPVPPTPIPPDDGKIHITFYHTMGSSLRAVLDKYIAEFNEIYPNITVEHKQVGGYDDVRNQIQTELTVGEHPNIAYCYPDHVALYNIAHAVQTLDTYIDSVEEITRADGSIEIVGLTQEQIADFIDGFYEEGREFGDGLMYSMPFSKSTEVLYYNKTFFDEHGLTVPTTWDEMEILCAKIKEIDPNCVPLGYDSEANWFITMAEQYNSPYTSATGEHFLFDNETNRNFVARLRDWYQKGYVTTQELSGGYTSALFTKDPSDFGNSYMCIGSSAGANHQIPKNDDGTFKFEVGVASIPQVDPSAPKVISQGPSLCIFKDSNPEEVLASWLFVKFLTTNVKFQAEFAMASGYIPVLESVMDHPIYHEMLNQANGYKNLPQLAIRVAMEQADAYFTSPAFNGSSAARNEVGKLMQFCMVDASCSSAAVIKVAFEDAVYECKYQIGE